MKTTKVKFYEVSYTKKIGGTTTIIVKGSNEENALNNAYRLRFTGKDFKIVKEVEKQQTAKGSGRNRMN